jgi:hypothetical protein
MTPVELRKNVLSTYFTLRLGIVVMSVLLPPVLYGLGRAFGSPLLGSMSAYYELDGLVRAVFVGTLCAVGSFLYLYKGFSRIENIALNCAGVAAVLVALIPCGCLEPHAKSNPWHVAAAVSFFLSMAFVCWFCAKDTLPLLDDPRTRAMYQHTYRIIGTFLVLSPALALAFAYVFTSLQSYNFFVEATGVEIFGIYWAIKSREFHLTFAEARAVHGQLANVDKSGVAPAVSPDATRA